MNEQMEIAIIIHRQISTARGKYVPELWRFEKAIAMNPQKRFGGYMKGGLKFHVSGCLYTGWIIVWLTGSDDYTVEFGKVRKGEWVTTETVDTVYADMLTDVIDRRVETPA